MQKEVKNKLSLKMIHIVLVLTLMIMSGIVVLSTFRLTRTFLYLANDEKQHGVLKQSAHELMEASDYLTQQVQRFVATGDTAFLDNYFKEATESKRREKSLEILGSVPNANKAQNSLQEAMNGSVALMDTEYYAMRLVIDAKNITDYPEVLNYVIISQEDDMLSKSQKLLRATQIVLGDDYYAQKDKIRSSMEDSVIEINRLMAETEEVQIASLKRKIVFVHIMIILQILFVIIMVRLTSILGIQPILSAAKKIKEGKPVLENGAKEFVYLAHAYNKMYQQTKSNLEKLSFKASHDELTGLYNRSGYDAILSTIDFSSTYMMLIDVDDFKYINDNFGHDIGDKALIKLAHILESTFRDGDYICRIGGDEFVVLITNSAGIPKRILESKISEIKHQLATPSKDVPSMSISVGIVGGSDVSPDNIFEMADKAMYKAKQQGKNTYTFYNVKEEKIC